MVCTASPLCRGAIGTMGQGGWSLKSRCRNNEGGSVREWERKTKDRTERVAESSSQFLESS